MVKRPSRCERGVGLVEVIIATVVGVIAILALAYTFGMGRGLVDRYEAARVALGAAQRRMDILSTLPPTSADLALDQPGVGHGPYAVQMDGRTVAYETWTVVGFHDPTSGTPAGAAMDLKKVTVSVAWGRRDPGETITLTRLFPVP